MATRIQCMFGNDTFSDITIKFCGQEIRASKSILARLSEYFYRAFSGGFPVADGNEVDLGDEDDADAIHAMFRYIYGFPYEAINRNLIFHVNVFKVADKYDVPSLRSRVVCNVRSHLASSECDASEIGEVVKNLCLSSSDKFADDRLRFVVQEACARKLPKLMKDPDFSGLIMNEEPFTGGLLVDLLNRGDYKVVEMHTCVSGDCDAMAARRLKALPGPSECTGCGNLDAELCLWRKVITVNMD